MPRVQKETFGRLLEGRVDALVGFSQTMVEITDADVLAKSGERFHPIVQQSGIETDRVEGMVFDVSQAELEQADSYEVDDYKRVTVELASGQTAWLYVANTQP